jgi:hypothetical protein
MPVSRRTVTRRPAARRAAPVRRTTTRKTATRKTTTTRKPATRKRATQGSALEPLGFSMPFRRSSRAAAVPSAAAAEKKNHTVRNRAIIGAGATAMAVIGAYALRNESSRAATKKYALHAATLPRKFHQGAVNKFNATHAYYRNPRTKSTVAGAAKVAAAVPMEGEI